MFDVEKVTQDCIIWIRKFFEENGQVIDRKLNVALTRARLQMIMTGHLPTLRQNAVFRKMIEEIEEKGGIWT